jgi:transposase
VLRPTLRRSLRARLKAPPRVYGWCRTRWSGATLALTLQAQRGITVSAATMRRGLHALDWVWKRAQLVAQDDDPPRLERLARLRFVSERWRPWEALVLADALASHWLPTVGSAGRPNGTQVEVMTPGTKEQHYLAGALARSPGTRHHGRGPRKPTGLLRELRPRVDDPDPAPQFRRV